MEQSQPKVLYPVSPEYEAYLQAKAEYLNADGRSVPLCETCKDKRVIFVVKHGSIMVRDCDCKAGHVAMQRMEASGLTEKLRMNTFESFIVSKPWQREMKEMARRFCEDTGKWFFAGGQVGSGKTHLCTAILGRLIDNGELARYMVWPDEVDTIKGDAEGYSQRLDELMKVPVLYVDDFLKSPGGATHQPTPGELRAAFKLVNYRYNREDKVTIFSSEFFIDEITTIDNGLGSRIHERCRSYRLEVYRDGKRNMRTST